ncbi:hypothetical protein ACFC4C_08860 [Streptomyces sp. NPDC056039]|uniref:hypothetical protein n=1 Tax=Streptomyces sp. NPDC056039 TaxID=3345687 RepID=UPI0035DFA2D4
MAYKARVTTDSNGRSSYYIWVCACGRESGPITAWRTAVARKNAHEADHVRREKAWRRS